MHSRHFYFIFLVLFAVNVVKSQAPREPELLPISQPNSGFAEGLKNAMAFTISINNFGFAIGAEYRRSISPFTDLIFETQWAGLKDDTEQSFQYVTGQQVVPNKQNRVMAFPMLAGVRKRVFAEQVTDNLRIYVSGQAGPTFAFAYPYYNQSQYADIPYFFFDDPNTFYPGPVPGRDPIIYPNEALSGWGQGEWIRGMAGQFALNADFGAGFKALQSLKIGYAYQYYPEGIQVLEAVRVVDYYPQVQAYGVVKGSPKQKFFATPVITLVLGGMW